MDETHLDLGQLLILLGLLLVASLVCTIYDYCATYDDVSAGDLVRWLLGRTPKDHTRDR